MNIKENAKFHISNYGCQMNYADAERFATILESVGLEATSSMDNADIIIFNSCSVKQSAEDRILGLARYINKLKAKNPNLVIVLTGCMARRTWRGTTKTGSPIQMTQQDRETQLQDTMPWVDYVIESKEFYKLPELLGKPIKHEVADYLSFKPHLQSSYLGYVPISTGCDHFCTYCIVPFARGNEICRSSQEILTEVKTLIEHGYTDIALLGQTVNRWINPIYDQEYKKGAIANTRIPELNTINLSESEAEKVILGKTEAKDFLQLLQAIDTLPGDFWITFMSSHPNYMTKELISFMGSSKHIRPYIHFALQSGSDAVLKRMNRRYNITEFVEQAKLLKKTIPHLGLSTDIIVGFPGETEEEFQETAKVMQELEFDMAYISEFSPRKGTPSALIPDDIPHAEKTRRKKYLNDEILAKTALNHNESMVGKTFKAIIEKISDKRVMGRTGNYKEVRVEGAENVEIGQFVDVKITSATPWALTGVIA